MRRMRLVPAAGTRLALVLAIAGGMTLLFAGSAQAFIYWASSQDNSIGRASNDGSGVDPHFIATGGLPFMTAVDSAHIYWVNMNGGSIGRANIDGSGVDNGFISGVTQPSGVAVNSSSIFWSTLGGSIGKANLDGSNRTDSLVTGIFEPCGLALDSGHVYWANDDGPPAHIGRADLNGNNLQGSYVTILPDASFPCGAAVNSSNIFWTDPGFFGLGGTNIGRANTNTGMGVDESLIGDASVPCGPALDAAQLYWANQATNTIGRSNTDGTAVNQSLVKTAGNGVCGVSVDDLQPSPAAGGGGVEPSNLFKLGKVRLNKRKGTATLPVTVPGPGALSLGGKGVKAQRSARIARGLAARAVTAPGTVKLKVSTKGKAKRNLAHRGRATVKVTITFTPSGGSPNARDLRIKLIRKR